jgi:beta-glucosidase
MNSALEEASMNTPDIETRVEALLSQMTLEEKVKSMYGDHPFWAGLGDILTGGYHRHSWNAGVMDHLGIEGIRFTDGPRGVVIAQSTTYPVSMARGATWDVDLEERIGEAIGLEARAQGANLFGGVCINLLRHPAWGRAQETYGEDSFHLGEFGAALTRGAQRHIMACVKHYALNSMENARFTVDVTVSPRALYEVYLPHFKRVVDEGVACVMSAYNSVNGEWCGQSAALLNDILKTRWGFQGFVVTDFIFGLRDAKTAALNGQDLEMPFFMHFHRDLLGLVQRGEVSESRVDDAVRRMLRMQLAFSSDTPDAGVIANPQHVALAREAAEKSIVLLKNEDELLPLVLSTKLAVIGRLADTPNTGDGGSSNTVAPYVITPLKGLREAFTQVAHDNGSDLERAKDVARDSDVVLLVVGYTAEDEGEFVSPDTSAGLASLFPPPAPEEMDIAGKIIEGLQQRRLTGGFARGGDRASLRLRPDDEALIAAVSSVNPNTIVAVMAGSAVLIPWDLSVKGILMLWYPGMEGGHALADILRGAVNPSGKLPFTIASSESHYPLFDREATAVTYDLWHGYRKLERDGNTAAYPFGFGQSYTSFEYSNLSLEHSDEAIRVQLEVTNTGTRFGEEIVQVYVAAPNSRVERAVKELKAFTRISLNTGETRTVTLYIPTSSLAYFDETVNAFLVEPLEYEFIAARHAGDEQSLRSRISVGFS